MREFDETATFDVVVDDVVGWGVPQTAGCLQTGVHVKFEEGILGC